MIWGEDDGDKRIVKRREVSITVCVVDCVMKGSKMEFDAK